MSVETTPATAGLSARARRRGSVVGYDFTAPARLSREHSRLLEIAFETFGRQWATQLGSRLRCASSVALTSVDQSTYDSYAAAIPTPSAMVVFALDATSGATGVLQLGGASAMAHLDHALGGIGGEQPQRPLTEIEVTMTLGMCERALTTLGYAFTAVGPIAAAVEGFHQDSQLMQAAKATEMVVVATFALQLGDHTAPVTLMLPLAAMLSRLAASAPQDVRSADELRRADQAARTLQATLTDVPVDVAVAMASLPVSPSRVLDLAVGDLLRLPHPATRPLDVTAAGVVVAHAVAASRGSRRACLITRHEEDPR